MRKAISITLKVDNLLWLRGQAARSAKGSVSDVLDRLVSDARASGKIDPAAMRSVAGTIDLPDDDADLAGADAYIRSLFAASAREPTLVGERPARAARRKAQPASPKRDAARGAKAEPASPKRDAARGAKAGG